MKRSSKHCDQFTYIQSLEFCLCPTLWICFIMLYQTYQSPISLYPCSSINLCLMLRRFSCRGYRTWPCLSCRVGYRCSLYCCLHVTFHLTIPASLLLPLPFPICINAICFLSARRFCQLTAYLFSIFTHSFSDCSLGNCHLFFTELSHLEQLFLLDTSLATGWKNYFGTYYAYLLFFVLRMFAIDLGTIVKVISRSPDSLGFIFCMLASRPSLLC